ncbi:MULTISPECIES: aldehyde dehydrogenase [Okeania]|uniref:Aldehyde dehydrogenase n=1 Tax=Okeania hirsuta TaxID=1458930 RepID=A0A3N6Q409_9CYAN|nr:MULTISPECIES: aldehyde dehydrogenase [Okeania]NES78458.1 aldehyde dehydrogenase [Okeania sp. SIO1H4]NES88805.1 aldehyde dehydrogenase [Okeania sp. SIO2B9]NET21759.1 aldehyde dehydrogenase [Okeania sp. SIO1H5]NET95965.1 aldehyde dehydrogenase [Okeania sp. SIO1H2]RQH57585.1 aldehyde dehydrogenase [Okeania hirsuta]
MNFNQSLISKILNKQRQFFATGKTRNVEFRIEQLKLLKQVVSDDREQIIAAIKADLNRPTFEGYFELGFVKEINNAIKKLKYWTKHRKVSTPIEQFPAGAKIYPEPLGVVLIIGPWNYPFQLVISPLLGAIAAGNCAIIKPSEVAANTSEVVANLIANTFDPIYIATVTGGVEITQQLLAEKFDHIFFTGGTRVGKIVMEAAAKNLTPVTLELGGKSPCIVDSDVQLEYTAKRIAWGKFINAGQTCVAPDYLLVNQAVKSDLLDKIKKYIVEFYGKNPANSPDYCRIINEKQFSRLTNLLQNGKIVIGGETNSEDRYIAPTIIEGVSWDSLIMQEEIFGPILPVLEYSNLEEAIAMVNSRPKPLSLYFFSRNKQKQEQVLTETSSGNVCINDTVMQFGVVSLPFGGVGNSGIGRYHGKASFDTFSHYKSVLKKGLWFDLSWRYAPYKNKISLIKKVIFK